MNHYKILLLLILIPAITYASESQIIDLGSRLELFVDDYLIEELDGTTLQLNHPVAREAVLHFDKPWEGRYCGYATVLNDKDCFRLYYRGLPKAGKDGSNTEVTCYAESKDGIVWEKPGLEIYEVNGTLKNNVILKDQAPFSHNFCPFIDTKPGIPNSERYKAVAGTSKSGLAGFVSGDGIHWKKIQEEPLITQGAFDSQNLVFWSESESRYVCYLRTWSKGEFKGYRSVSRAISPDFIHWSEPVEMSYGGTTREHLYTNQTLPYFRAPHIYLSFPARFMPGRRVLGKEEFEKLGGESKYSGDCSDTCFMSSRGTNQYTRTFMEGFIRPGLGLQNWSSRTNYTVYGLIPTGEGELSMFIQRNYGQPSQYLQRLTVRTDGFVSVHAPYDGGEMVTKPLRFNGDRLVLNYATSAAGSIWVEIQDREGKAVPGFTLKDCDEIIGDRIERAVTWKGSPDVDRFQEQTVRLRFVMKDADLYSMRFGSGN